MLLVPADLQPHQHFGNVLWNFNGFICVIPLPRGSPIPFGPMRKAQPLIPNFFNGFIHKIGVDPENFGPSIAQLDWGRGGVMHLNPSMPRVKEGLRVGNPPPVMWHKGGCKGISVVLVIMVIFIILIILVG